MKRKLLLLTTLLTLVVMTFVLISCGGNKCEHTYLEECDTTCEKCGEARETEVEHTYYGDCDSACHKCGEEREDVIEHKWVQIPNDTSCSVREACEGCGAIKGEITPHNWQEATCVAPKTCTVCGATEGEALEHIPEEDDYDCTTALKCQNCDYIFVSAKSHAVDEENIYSTDEVHYNECTNEGCEVQFNKEAHSGKDDGDCTTWVLCKCGWLVKEANESHTAEEDDGDCTTALKCQNCEYIFVSAKSHAVDEEKMYSTEEVHFNKCTNEGCKVQINKEAHSGEDDGDCTTWVLCKCGWLVKEANESHTAEEDDGDCTTAVKCVNCEQIVVKAYDSHILKGCICENCGITEHEFSSSKLCQCAICGEYIHTLDENCICTVCGAIEHKEVDLNTGICSFCNGFVAAASITINGTKSYYSTLEDAAYAVIQNGEGIIVLENDTTTSNVIDVENYTITLDLNGKTLNSISSYSFRLYEDGSLTVKDSVGAGLIASDIGVYGGSLSIEGGMFANITISKAKSVNITGGEIKILSLNGDHDTLSISGGSFDEIYIYKEYNTPAGILETGYCYYDSDGNKMDVSALVPEEYWYKVRNVTVGKDE